MNQQDEATIWLAYLGIVAILLICVTLMSIFGAK